MGKRPDLMPDRLSVQPSLTQPRTTWPILLPGTAARGDLIVHGGRERTRRRPRRRTLLRQPAHTMCITTTSPSKSDLQVSETSRRCDAAGTTLDPVSSASDFLGSSTSRQTRKKLLSTSRARRKKSTRSQVRVPLRLAPGRMVRVDGGVEREKQWPRCRQMCQMNTHGYELRCAARHCMYMIFLCSCICVCKFVCVCVCLCVLLCICV